MALSFLHTFVIILLQLHIIITGSCTNSDNNECDYCLSQTDFNYGTYRIIASGLYCIEEHIIFDPLPGNKTYPNAPGSWFPSNDTYFPGCREQKDGAYALGFFAVISIEASNIKLDLNHYKIEYHPYFYLQQRFGSIIEISNQPFLPNSGPANFGSGFKNVENITICNGELGLNSHHGIHANNASNIIITNLSIYDFEVAAIQINGFNNVYLTNLDIGPSLHNVPLTAYYSNARFLLLALRKLLNEIEANNIEIPSVSFSYLHENNALSLYEIHNNLVNAMDLMIRYTMNPHHITEKERQSVLFRQSLDLFKNHHLLPDGSALYGIILNSFNVAVNGFGAADNNGINKGNGAIIENVLIHDLKLRVNEVSAMYFDRCSDSETDSVTILKGPFGDVLDIKKMIDPQAWHIIDEYGTDSVVFNDIQYIGNPLADAQIALFLYKDHISDGSNYGFGSYLSPHFIEWTLNHDASLPVCTSFKCNTDIMFHANKGIVGLRMDGIENAEIHNVDITHIENISPLASFTCGNYTGIHNEGAMSTDIRAISVTDSDLIVSGVNNINDMISWNGDITGVALMQYASVVVDDESALQINDLSSATKVSETQYEHLLHVQHGSLFPNNFQKCDISTDETSEIDINYLSQHDCKPADFESVEIPQICHDRCDAFSILLSDTTFISDSVCLTYNIQRLHSKGFCYKDIQHIVLLMCDSDENCDEDDLNGLIEAIYDVNGAGLYAWSTTIKHNDIEQRGIRINIEVQTNREFTICLRDVWNVNEEMSHAVSIKRGKKTFVCDEEYIMGLPCIDNDKFMNGAYLNSGYNRKFARYNVHKYNKYKYNEPKSKYHAMSIAQEDTNSTDNERDTIWFIIWSVVIIIAAISCCVALWMFKLNICNNKGQRNTSSSYRKANTSNDEDEEEIMEGTMDEQLNICTIGNEDNSTQYEHVYYDESQTNSYN